MLGPHWTWGLSPRGRGNRLVLDRTTTLRVYPRVGGETPDSAHRGPTTGSTVYPRVGGETPLSLIAAISCRGLSPRGRGNRPWPLISLCLGSIPAWAETWTTGQGRLGSGLSPRGRGNGPIVAGSIPAWAGKPRGHVVPIPPSGLSPRGRGNHLVVTVATGAQWSIPAWAGKPVHRRQSVTPRSTRVYPRVGGETSVNDPRWAQDG